ncbi:MAG: hypothetical protein AAFX46_03655 [Cyanobacteria bacterium J06636_27]
MRKVEGVDVLPLKLSKTDFGLIYNGNTCTTTTVFTPSPSQGEGWDEVKQGFQIVI